MSSYFRPLAFTGWICALLVVSGALLWPALLNGQPAYFFDTPGYYNGGAAAVGSLAKKLGIDVADAPTGGAIASQVTSSSGVVATRAIAYSVFAYASSWPNARFYLTVAIQSLVASGILLLWWKRVLPSIGWRGGTLAGLAVAAVTSAPWFTSFVMPDIFAGLALLGYLILVHPSTTPLGLGARIFVVFTIALAFTVHASHIPTLVVVAGFAVAHRIWTHRRQLGATDAIEIGWLSAPILVGFALVLGSSTLGFSEVSLAPKRLPLVLTRSIEDGPGRWYLEKACPTKRYVICDMFPVMPRRQVDLLWGPGGLRARATPEQMDAIRREEPEIVAAAARAYPLQQMSRAAKAFARQIFAVGLDDLSFSMETSLREGGKMTIEEGGPDRAPIRPIVNFLIFASALAATLYLAVLMIRAPSSAVNRLVALILIGLLTNAGVTSILSAVAQRYQSRVIWIVPVVALGLYLARREAERRSSDGLAATVRTTPHQVPS